MRKGVIVYTAILSAAILCGGFIFKSIKDRPTENWDEAIGDAGPTIIDTTADIDTMPESVAKRLRARMGSPVALSFDEQQSQLGQKLQDKDVAWVRSTTEDLKVYEDKMSASEESRRELLRQQEMVRQQFLEKQKQLAEEQQALYDELDRKAREAIEAEGGLPEELVGREGEPLYPVVAQAAVRGQIGKSDEGDSSVADGTSNVGKTQGAMGRVAEEEYLGQFKAKFYCTCEDDFDSSEWRNVNVGDNFVWADSEYIKIGSTVTLSEGSEKEFEVRDGGDMVSGREIIVFNSTHGEYNGNATLYPGVTEVIKNMTTQTDEANGQSGDAIEANEGVSEDT